MLVVPNRLVAWMTAIAVRDVIANHLLHLTQHLSLDTRHFAGIYLLLAHGLNKPFLASEQLKRRLALY